MSRTVRLRSALQTMIHNVTLIPGDGIGPEVTQAVVHILDHAGLDIEWSQHEVGVTAVERTGLSLPPSVLDAIKTTRVALKGPATTPIGGGFPSVNVGLRQALGLYANVRPVFSLPGVTTRFDGVDLVVIRENTEDLYSGLEHEVVPGVVESLKVITRSASERIARFAFDYAREAKRRRVTAVHKANILKMGDGLFLESVRTAARDYDDIVYDERIVDATSMHLVLDPSRFDILLLPNLYGDIVSDLCAGLVGGLGLVPSANIGQDIAVFEAVHGTAPDIAGQNVANPTALLLSAVLMLRRLGEHTAADRIVAALHRVLVTGHARTPDLGGTSTTMEFAGAIASQLAA